MALGHPSFTAVNLKYRIADNEMAYGSFLRHDVLLNTLISIINQSKQFL